MPRVHIPDLPWEEQHSPARTFHSYCQNISIALGGIRNGGTWCGGHPFDLQIRRIPAGASVCPFHSHFAQWEMFAVRSGTGRVRAGPETHVVNSGDVFFHPPGDPHQLTNPGPGELEVLIVADNPALDAFHYPDSNKWGLRPPGKYFRMHEVGYFDGEEAPLADTPPYRPSGSPAAAPLPSFALRKLRSDDVPWDEWHSPGGKFHGCSKELSVALGAKRNLPTGLGGHPFDLELNKLAPGEAGCPLHSHAAQWELFLILNGQGRVRAGTDVYPVTAGDAILHPPGEAHQIRAAIDGELVFLLIADNPPVDYWHYPDSNKWGLRAPRKFFRPTEVDYWDGEE
jgi:uncharacterized cupin superfamily protein